MSRRAFVLLLVTFAPVATAAPRCDESYRYETELRVPCSATWRLEATCSGRDLAQKWKVSGRTNSPDGYIRPWLDYPITVIGYELLVLREGTKVERAVNRVLPWFDWSNERTDWWFMIGSTIQPDGILTVGPGQTHRARFLQLGEGHPWPAKGPRPANSAVDPLLALHGQCYGNRPIAVLLTVHYRSD